MSPFFQAAKNRIGLLIILMSILIVVGGYALNSRWSKNESEKLEQNSGISNAHDEIEAKSQLAMELQQQCRFVEAKTVAREAIRLGASHMELVLIVCDVRVPLKANTSVEEGSLLLVDARKLMLEGNDDFALDLLRKAISLEPNHLQAQGWYGQILAQNHSPEFATWNAALPMNAENHAAILFARGLALEENGQHDDAIKFYLAILQRNSIHAQVAARLENLLKQDQKRYEIHSNELKALKRLNRLAEDLVHAPDFEVMRRLHKILHDLGDFELANGLARSARELGCAEDWAKQILSGQTNEPPRYLSRISNRHSSPTISEEDTDWETFQFLDSLPPSLSVEAQDFFIDIASDMGIKFQYENGSDPQSPLGHLFETTGGGVAVFDYDMDGWPDLYFAQGGNWRENPAGKNPSDQIYRNQSGDFSRNVTQLANIAEFNFSQGVTVGDFNSDGFPDLYLCNLGANRLFENQGDGTFLDVSHLSNTQMNDWSISAAFADFNKDGLADLYVVNYLEMEAVRNSPCFIQGKLRACPPTKFQGTPDAVYLNLGNGAFRQLNPHRDESEFFGKGMGLVVADLTGDGELNVFVGNDGQENHHYQVTTSTKSSLPVFEENAIPLGLATNREGVKHATMGIAAGDTNNDGRIDLFTTNFYGETNTLFINHESSHFEDRTTSFGDLDSSSLSMLGFGTQFVDVELDGDFDLFVANGHIDRTSVTGEPDVMLPQFFQNKGKGEFLAKGFAAPNSYFETPALGRAVARLDWNRDGRSDLAVTHLDRSAALLLNHHPNPGNSATFHLTGTISERDAVGAVVTLESGAQVWQQQVDAGNGYEASNEKCLIFGLGARELIDQIKVNWPNGMTEVYPEVKTGRKYRIIEGQGLYAFP